MKAVRPALLRFLVLVLSALALQGLPLIFSAAGDNGGVALYLIHLHAVIPLCAFFIPLWAARGGVHPLAGFFPIGGALLLLPVYSRPGMGLICMILSLIGGVAGQEWEKRKEAAKGNHHGTGKKQTKK